METVSTHRKPWWRRLAFRLSVRALIVVVLAIGVGLGWVVHRARTQRMAVAAIQRAGGKVEYDWEWTDKSTSPPTKPAKPWPKWLVDAVGVDYLADVVSIQLNVTLTNPVPVTDDLMREVGRLGRLKSLGFYSCDQVTDAGLAHLGHLSSLRYLVIGSRNISDAGLGSLRDLDLRGLYLSEMPGHVRGPGPSERDEPPRGSRSPLHSSRHH